MKAGIRLASFWLATVTVACTTQPDKAAPVNFAVVPPSAIVETREAPSAAEKQSPTRVVVLGTGTPIPDAFRAGPSIAVIHRGEAYLFDAGAGAVRQATIARYRYDIPALYPSQICCVFLTHLHSDHTLDLSELAHTLWWRRRDGLQAWGPTGIAQLAAALSDLIAVDAALRINGLQPVENPAGYQVQANEIKPGPLFEKEDLRIEAFAVDHGDVAPAFGFKITTDDLSVVISGDTTFSDTLVAEAQGVDILFHEVISREGLARNSPGFQRYHDRAHTTTEELARLAEETQPGLLVLYHGLFYGTEESSVLDEIRPLYEGDVVLASDLQVFP